MQIRTAKGDSIWPASPIGEFTSGEWVNWNGSEWYVKAKDITTCEIVGYQLASFLGLPLQPWLAFMHHGKARSSAHSFGVLIQKWSSASSTASLDFPATIHPDIFSRALVLAVMDRFEWPVWLLNEGSTELRLIDLERVGVIPAWPLQRTAFAGYRMQTKEALSDCRREADSAGILSIFESDIRKFICSDLSSVIDLSGSPLETSLRKTLYAGLSARIAELHRLLLGVRLVQRRIKSCGRRSSTPRKSRRLHCCHLHASLGYLEGVINIKPGTKNTWDVRWNIGSMDNDMELSSFFEKPKYTTLLDQLISRIESSGRTIRILSSSLRWGQADRLSTDAAADFSDGILECWKQVLLDWNTKRPTSTL